jgi:hypothetical protein
MKKHFSYLLFLIFLSCGKGEKNAPILLPSSGNINDISVIIANDLWAGFVGDSIRAVIAEPVYGLPQEEPRFSLKQIPPDVFSGFVKKSRTILRIIKADEASTKYYKNPYASPQTMVVVSGPTPSAINNQILNNAANIIAKLQASEFAEKRRRIKKALYNSKSIEDHFGIKIQFPSVYRVAKADSSFYWIRKDNKTGSVNLMLYSIPINSISFDAIEPEAINRFRDSVARLHIPGPTKSAFMTTEDAYVPQYSTSLIQGKKVMKVRSLWKIKGAFMSGPFLTYIIQDIKNSRLLIAEGFVYAPSLEKRDFIFELEAIIQSIKIE